MATTATRDPYNTLKRDQGIRIYLNRGDLQFVQTYFYPMYGVYGAELEDFDLDGDLDIAAIAFHPDFSPESRKTSYFWSKRTRSFFCPEPTRAPTWEDG